MTTSLSKGTFTADDLNKAELEIIRHCLREKFQENIYILQKGEQSHMQARPGSSRWNSRSISPSSNCARGGGVTLVVLLLDKTALRNSWVIGKGIQSVLDGHRYVCRVCVQIKNNKATHCQGLSCPRSCMGRW